MAEQQVDQETGQPTSTNGAQPLPDQVAAKREVYLRVAEALPQDVERAIARIDPLAFEALGIEPGALVTIQGRRSTVVRVEPDTPATGRHMIRLDGMLRDNVYAGIDARVTVRRAAVNPALAVFLAPPSKNDTDEDDADLIRRELTDRVLSTGDEVKINELARGPQVYRVLSIEPEEIGLVSPETAIRFQTVSGLEARRFQIRYEDIGGLEEELRRVREIVELPMKYPALFARLRIEPPRGVLLHGPPGTGKTLIARAIASEVEAQFIHVNGPEIMQKYYGESEARLREIFDEAQRKAPSVIFLDEIDALAPKRADVSGEVEKRVVAQLLALMDGLVARGRVVVIGATNLPDMVDPALRRPGRFDREVPVNVPNRVGRLEILRIHSRGMPLAKDVELERLAEVTHGFVGADIEMLCKEAGMLALHDVLEQAGLEVADPTDLAAGAEVHLRHFLTALRQIQPTATREVFVEKPNQSWADVGGLRDVRDFLNTAVVLPRLHPELFMQAGIRPPKGIMLSGRSGTGKTLVARALANESDMSFITADAAMIFSKWMGESERILREVFVKAKQAAPCLLFFDEIDALAPRRGQGESSSTPDRIIGQFLSELDNLDELSEVVVLGATNRLDLVEPALLSQGRFGYVVEFPLPEEQDRLAILKIHADKLPLADDVNLQAIVRDSDSLTGSDLALICHQAAMAEIRSLSQNGGDLSQTLLELRVPQARLLEALVEVQRGRDQRAKRSA
jgi:transitional endoplasmic reticulum ATPase